MTLKKQRFFNAHVSWWGLITSLFMPVMTTPYALLARYLGLSDQSAASLHGVSPDTAAKWLRGARNPARARWCEAMALVLAMEPVVARWADVLAGYPEGMAPAPDVPETDAEAEAMGWPDRRMMIHALGWASARARKPWGEAGSPERFNPAWPPDISGPPRFSPDAD